MELQKWYKNWGVPEIIKPEKSTLHSVSSDPTAAPVTRGKEAEVAAANANVMKFFGKAALKPSV